jgi:hypothetical protein
MHELARLERDRAGVARDLRRIVRRDEGWRRDWWYLLQKKPDLELLHDEPEFQAMLGEIRADLAAQLERVQEMERRGQLAFPAAPPRPSLSSVAEPPH